MKRVLSYVFVLLTCFVLLDSQQQFTAITAQEEKRDADSAIPRDIPRVLIGVPAQPAAQATVNIADLARIQAETPPDLTPRIMVPPNQIIIAEDKPRQVGSVLPAPDAPGTYGDQTLIPSLPNVVSPSPSTSYIGHDDVVKVGTGTIVIPPDTTGAVGLTEVVTFLNNNFVVQTKSTGAVTSAISIDTFFTGLGATGPFDPRIVYDPYSNRWIVAAVSDSEAANSSIVLGVSQTSNPAGAYFLFRLDVDSTNRFWADFPTIGFNKNWVSINVNMIRFVAGGAVVGNKDLVIDYPSLRTGVFSGTVFTGTTVVTSPAITYSSTENTLYQVVHLDGAGAQYAIDTVTGIPPAAPTYTIGATKVRTGGGWTEPTGQILPQATPLSGASSCGATPCRLETQDSFVRSSPVLRNGFIYYAQTIGLPAGVLTRTAVQWTKITAATGNFADGGRVDDPTATATNGGKWYAYPSISVNANNDVMFGFSQFASTQFPSAGYTYRFHPDAPGLMRDPVIYKAGEDYYNKTFGTGRNRYGDYSATQVDPSNDLDLWTIQEYAKARVGTDDGTTGSNSSRWSTWWAKVSFDPTAAGLTIGGRIQTAGGRNISRAVVSLVDSSGRVRTAISNPFGRYQFEDVAANETYFVTVTAKGYEFTPQVITVTQAMGNVDFTAQ